MRGFCSYRRVAATVRNPERETLYFCAWLFSNCGCQEEAAAAYKQLLNLYPHWAEGYRHASGSLAAIGAAEEAIEYAIEACARAPQEFEYALHGGVLLLRAGYFEAQADHLRRAISIEPHQCPALRQMSAGWYGL